MDHAGFDALLDLCIAATGDDFHVMALNMRQDARIHPTRISRFCESILIPNGQSLRPADLHDAVVDYLEECVRPGCHPLTEGRNAPDFLTETLNAWNYIQPLPPGTQLARVINLAALEHVFRAARDLARHDPEGYPQFRIFTESDREYRSFLDHHLSSSKPEPALSALLSAMNIHRIDAPYQPAWATLWTELVRHFQGEENLLAAPAQHWRAAVGIPTYTEGQWCVLLRYDAAEAGPICRPTQLDAGWFACHFPSHISDTVGRCMELVSPGNDVPLPEVIHAQIDHDLRHWLPHGLSRTTAKLEPDYQSVRIRHGERLCQHYGQDVYNAWRLRCW